MLLKVMVLEVDGLEPEGKYLLARLATALGKSDSGTTNTRELAKRFDLPNAHVSNALAILVSRGVLACTSVREGRGGAKKRYAFDKSFLQKLETVELPQPDADRLTQLRIEGSTAATLHQAVIARLLEHENRARGVEAPKEREDAKTVLLDVRARRRPGGLTAVNRLLLAVLLVHADRFGVVRDLGSVELLKATGLGSEHLKNRVKRLIKQGLIRAYIPGATSGVMFGKAKSIYFINLHHSELSGERHEATVLARKVRVDPDVLACDEAFDLFDWAHQFSKSAPMGWPPKNRMERLDRIQGFFPASDRRRIAPVLQSRLEHYASILLSECWGRLPETHLRIPVPPADLIPQLFDRIETELFPPRKQRAKGRSLPKKPPVKLPSTPHQLLLVQHLFEEAFRIATQVKCLFISCIKIPFEKMDYMILSRRSNGPIGGEFIMSCAVLALSKVGAVGHGCYVIGSGVEPQHYAVEAGIPVKDRLVFGLVAKAAESGAG